MRFLKTTLPAFLLLIFLGSFSNRSFSQSSSRFSAQNFIQNGDTLRYRLLFPDADTLRKYPLVIFLHGSGERGNDNEAQLKWGVQNFATDEMMHLHPAVVIAPQCPTHESWSHFSNSNHGPMSLLPTPAKSMELLIALIHQAVKNLPVDTNRIYITGLSMGGFGTYDAIERYPNLFAAAVPVCGGGDVTKAPSIAHIPMWIFHGSEDPTVNPLYSLNMAEALRKAGAHPGLTMYPETGHFSWIAAYSDPAMMEWLFRQHK
ncbi:MAG: prolyl oligopeptidase family serine peptidase [Bacteroidota bacterium]|nr:prolyl oligopeptidase family serine peptidase [Bacteroidota bacterium]